MKTLNQTVLFQAGFRKIHESGHPLISYREVLLRKVKLCGLLKKSNYLSKIFNNNNYYRFRVFTYWSIFPN
jgi:hypothetical protein